MLSIIFKPIRKLYDWVSKRVHSPYALWWLSILMALESFIFPVPIDPLLILFCVENPKKSFRYAALSTAASVIGAAIGYGIGLFLWHILGPFFTSYVISQATFEALRAKYELYQTWAVLIAGFTPIPFKAVTLSAGFCSLPFAPFIFYSILARGARFFLLGAIIRLWGKKIKQYIDVYFDWLVLLFAALVFIFIWVLL
jgi:membrane protein YqaA with SNARE-associated domain